MNWRYFVLTCLATILSLGVLTERISGSSSSQVIDDSWGSLAALIAYYEDGEIGSIHPVVMDHMKALGLTQDRIYQGQWTGENEIEKVSVRLSGGGFSLIAIEPIKETRIDAQILSALITSSVDSGMLDGQRMEIDVSYRTLPSGQNSNIQCTEGTRMTVNIISRVLEYTAIDISCR